MDLVKEFEKMSTNEKREGKEKIIESRNRNF